MFGVFKVWPLKRSNVTRRHSISSPPEGLQDLINNQVVQDEEQEQDVISPQEQKQDGEESDTQEMTAYDSLLICPVCDQLFMHPVLLPCQHSMCYGCARAQILMKSDPLLSPISDESMSMTSFRDSPQSPPDRFDSSHQEDGDSDYGSIKSPSPTPNDQMYGFTSPTPSEFNGSFRSPTIVSSPKTTKPMKKRRSMRQSRTQSSLQACKENTPTINVQSPPPPSLERQASSLYSPTFTAASARNRRSGLRRSMSVTSLAGSTCSTASLPVHRANMSYDALKRSKVKSLYCPACDDNVDLGKLGISGLFRNFALERIVEKTRQADKKAHAIRCGYCKPPATEATKSCLDCKLSFCNECFKMVHTWGTKRAQHVYVPPTNNFARPKVLYCPAHSREAVTMYCNKCHVGVCRMCKTKTGCHHNHPVTAAKSVYKEKKETLRAGLAILKQKKEEIEAKINSINERFDQLEKSEAITRQQINSGVDEMHRLLERKRNELMLKCEGEGRSKETSLKEEAQACRNALAKATLEPFIEEVLKESEPNYFMQIAPMVSGRLTEAINDLTNEINKDIDFEPLTLSLDISKEVDTLEKLQFLTVPSTPVISTINEESLTFSQPLLAWDEGKKNDETSSVATYTVRAVSTDEFRAPSSQLSAEEHLQTPDQQWYRVPSNASRAVSVRSNNSAGSSNWTNPVRLESNASNFFKFETCYSADEADLIIDCDGTRATLPPLNRKTPIAIKGDTPMWGGEYYWEMIVSSKGSADVVLGVSSFKASEDISLHGTNDGKDDIRSGCLIDIKGGQCIPYDDDDSFLNAEKFISNSFPTPPTNGACRKPGRRIGNLICKIAIQVIIQNGCEAHVTIYDVTEECDGRVAIHEKLITYSPPLWPVWSCSGPSVITLC